MGRTDEGKDVPVVVVGVADDLDVAAVSPADSGPNWGAEGSPEVGAVGSPNIGRVGSITGNPIGGAMSDAVGSV